MASGGWEFDPRPPAHALWAARLPTVRAVMYASGKLVLQGRDAARAAEEYLGAGAGAAPGFRVALREPVLGSDEAGKGDFLGPVVAAAVLVRPGQEGLLREFGVRDSKEMGDREAREAAALVRASCPHAVVAVEPPRYNDLHRDMGGNLNRLLAWAHARALEDVLESPAGAGARGIVVDQFVAKAVFARSLLPRAAALPLEVRPRAEDHPSVAAASVLARAAFLEALDRMGAACGVKLAKGAGPPADQAARRVLAKGGAALLARVAKMHFRNAAKVGAR
jgi:ribonuclease HIII